MNEIHLDLAELNRLTGGEMFAFIILRSQGLNYPYRFRNKSY